MAQSAPATETGSAPTLSVANRLVIVPAVVRDKKGVLVRGLAQDSFALEVDGKAQPIRYFDTDANLPYTVGLLIDTSGSMRDKLDDERTASVAFLDKMLTPERDSAFVIQFAREVDLLADVTMSRPKLQQALKELDGDRPGFGSGGQNGSGDSGSNGDSGGHDGGNGGRSRGPGGAGGGGTALYDAVFLASDEMMPKQKGRRALILLTDGEDRGSRVTLARAIEAAQRADTVVYAIYYKGEGRGGFGGRGPGGGRPGGSPGGGGRQGGGFPFPFPFEASTFGQPGGGSDVDGRKVLERMCGETGGRVYEVKGKQTVGTIYADIAEELRSQYRLGFTPSAEAASEGYHELLLKLNGEAAKAKDTVQAREGYYTK